MLMLFPLLYRYGTDRLFQSTVKLLKKGARLHVKRKAVHLLHMLLNCKHIFLFGYVLSLCSYINLIYLALVSSFLNSSTSILHLNVQYEVFTT